MAQDREGALEIAVVDDDPAVRDSLALIFELEGFQVQSFSGAEEVLGAAKKVKPNCLLLDLHLPVRSGLDVLEAIGGARYPAPVLMISGQGDIPMAVAAIKAGAHDFIEKPFDAEAVIERVREAVRVYRERGQTEGSTLANRRFAGAEMLTARELEVLEQVAQGASNKEAGRRLGISPRTVEVHRARIMEKLGARNTADLIRIVLSEGDRF